MEEKPKMKNLFIEMPVDDHQALRMLAATRGITMKQTVIELIHEATKKEVPAAVLIAD
jgi:macrodomain Ter protein organizer (MatP/YcbG family)